MSQTEKIQALIIRQMQIAEADGIFFVISPTAGLLRLKARGIKKISSKNSPYLQSLSYVNLNIIEGKTNLNIITSVDSIQTFRNIRRDLKKITFAQFLVEHYLMIVGDDVNAENFSYLLQSLKAVDEMEVVNIKNRDLIYIWLIIKILETSGRKPELYECVRCQNKIKEAEKIIFNPEYGGIICENCQKNVRMGFVISSFAVKLFRLLSQIDICDLEKIKTLNTTENNFRILNGYIQHYLENPIKSEKFLNQLMKI